MRSPEVEQLVARGRERMKTRSEGRERTVEVWVATSFVAVAVAMALFLDSPIPLDVPTLVVLVAAYTVTCYAKFEVADGWTVPTELVLVPMLFLLPTPIVPLVVSLSWALGRLIDYVSGETNIRRAFYVFGDCWHAVGPALVLIVAGAQVFDWSEWPVYAVALLAQLAFDIGAITIRSRLIDGTSPRSEMRLVAPVYALDATLAPVGLVIAFAATERGVGITLLVLPLAALLAVLSRERQVRVDHALELRDAYQGTAMLLAEVVETDDAYTGSHSRGVVELSRVVGDELGVDPIQRRNLEFGALLHDIGKITIPKAIINKPGPLDDAEWEIIRRHTIEGERMLGHVGGVLGEVGKIVRASHERFEGGGYPDGLVAEEIPIEARIVTCCDAFSAMTTTRPYREAMPVLEAIAELRACAGTQFDPQVVEVLAELIERELAEERAVDAA